MEKDAGAIGAADVATPARAPAGAVPVFKAPGTLCLILIMDQGPLLPKAREGYRNKEHLLSTYCVPGSCWVLYV